MGPSQIEIDSEAHRLDDLRRLLVAAARDKPIQFELRQQTPRFRTAPVVLIASTVEGGAFLVAAIVDELLPLARQSGPLSALLVETEMGQTIVIPADTARAELNNLVSSMQGPVSRIMVVNDY